MKKNDKKTVMTKVKGHTKTIANLIVGYSVGEVVGTLLKDCKPDAKGFKKLVVKLGVAAMTGMIVKMATDYVSGEIDEVFEMVEKAEKMTEDTENSDENIEEEKEDEDNV